MDTKTKTTELFWMLIEGLQQYPDLLNAIGVTGSVIYILSFNLVQTGRMDGNGIAYAFSKVIAASFVMLSLATAFNLASLIIQSNFILVGLYGVITKYNRRRRCASLAALAAWRSAEARKRRQIYSPGTPTFGAFFRAGEKPPTLFTANAPRILPASKHF